MVVKSLLFSFLVSLISIAIVVFAPFTISVRSTGKVYSPFLEDMLELQAEAEQGLHPSSPVWKKLDELTEKNNRWHEEQKKEFLAKSSTTVLGAWKKKSSILAPGIMILWGVLFYFFCRRKPSNYALLVLVFPLILTIAQLMSLLEFVLIAFAVLAVWFMFLPNPPKASPPESKSTQS